MKILKGGLLIALCACVVFVFTACGRPYSDIDFDDYIKVGKYKGLEVESYTIKVTDKEVEEEIDERLEAAAETKSVKSGKVEDGDTVIIDFKGTIDGKEFDNGSGEDQSLTIGSGQYIDGFEDGLIGVKVGDTKTLNLTFPDDYNDEDVAGKDVKFKVTVTAKREKVVPELDEDFVKDNSKYDTVAEYKKSVKKDLEEEKEESAIQEQKDYLWEEVVSDTEVKKDDDDNEKYPEDEVDETVEFIKEQYESYAEQQDMELEDMIEQMGMTEKEFNKQCKSYAKSVVKENMIVYYIADKEDIDVSKDEYNQYIEDSLESIGYSEDEYEEATGKSFEEANGEDNIWTACYKEKVLDLLLDKAKVVDELSEDDDEDKDDED